MRNHQCDISRSCRRRHTNYVMPSRDKKHKVKRISYSNLVLNADELTYSRLTSAGDLKLWKSAWSYEKKLLRCSMANFREWQSVSAADR